MQFVKTWMEQHCKLYFVEDKLGTALADFSKFMAERSGGEDAGSKQLFLGEFNSFWFSSFCLVWFGLHFAHVVRIACSV